MKLLGALLGAALCLPFAPAASARPVVLDRAVVRFVAPETGGVASPRFVFERQLAFEARLDALADPDRVARARAREGVEPYRDRHVRGALDRHIAETLLAALRIDPEPKRSEIEARVVAARAALMRALIAESETMRPCHTASISSSVDTRRSRAVTR